MKDTKCTKEKQETKNKRKTLLLSGEQIFKLLAQAQHFFMLFQQHCKHEHFEGQGMCGVLGSRQVLAGTGEQVVQGQLIGTAQGAPEAGEGGFFLQENLCGGRKGTTHIFTCLSFSKYERKNVILYSV
jgi:hypothetical protein